MHDTQTVQPSKNLADSFRFLLVWLPYENGQAIEDRYVTTPFIRSV